MTNENTLYIATHSTRKDEIACVVQQSIKITIENAPDNSFVTLRDFHGYGNDYDLYANEIKFVPIPQEYTEIALGFFSSYIDRNEDAIYDLIRSINEKQDSL